MSSPSEPTARRREFIRADPDLPVHTVGECLGSHRCRQYKVDLADGWCVSHWDYASHTATRRDRRAMKSWEDKDE